jgi:transcription elongation factor GreA
MQKIQLTKQYISALKKELSYRETLLRKKLRNELGQTGYDGDLRENSGYMLALESQEVNENRIANLKEILAFASPLQSPQSKDIKLGSIIKLQFGDKILQYQIVNSIESNPDEGKISIISTVGEKLLGKTEGDVIVVNGNDIVILKVE